MSRNDTAAAVRARELVDSMGAELALEHVRSLAERAEGLSYLKSLVRAVEEEIRRRRGQSNIERVAEVGFDEA